MVRQRSGASDTIAASMIDAHHHFWTLARGDYDWLTADLPVLYRDFGPGDLTPLLDAGGIRRSVLVQAAPTVAETRHLIGIANTWDRVAAVVGWVDLADPAVETVLDELAGHAVLRGIRPMIQDIADDDWMLGPAVERGLCALVERGLRFDALVLPRHLSRLRVLLERHPDLPVVIDHGAKPEIAHRRLESWAQDIARIASETNACCKLSGLVTEAGTGWRIDDLRPVVDHLLASFGSDRLMWGSDWPVVELAGGFARWRETSLALLASLDAEAQAAILGGTAARFYGIPSD